MHGCALMCVYAKLVVYLEMGSVRVYPRFVVGLFMCDCYIFSIARHDSQCNKNNVRRSNNFGKSVIGSNIHDIEM